MKTERHYHDFYLKCDVLLLADVFGKFKNNGFKNYGLWPCAYLSAQVLSWNSMLQITKIKLKSIPDPDMLIFFEKGTKGGISYISNRYSKVSNNYLKSYYRKQESKRIIYLDANNLCGCAMYKFHATGGFKWIDPKEFDLNKCTSNISKRFVLEVDIKYPKELHKLYNENPLASDK